MRQHPNIAIPGRRIGNSSLDFWKPEDSQLELNRRAVWYPQALKVAISPKLSFVTHLPAGHASPQDLFSPAFSLKGRAGSVPCQLQRLVRPPYFVDAAFVMPASAFSIFDMTSSQPEILCLFSKYLGSLYDIQTFALSSSQINAF